MFKYVKSVASNETKSIKHTKKKTVQISFQNFCYFRSQILFREIENPSDRTSGHIWRPEIY